MAELDLGRIIPFNRGDYSPTETYVNLDFVLFDGSTYLCISKTPVIGGSIHDSLKWKLIAKSGVNGVDGHTAFEVWNIANGGSKTIQEYFDYLKQPAQDASDDYNNVVKPNVIAKANYAEAQGDYAKEQGEAVEGTVSSINSNTLTIEEVTAQAIVALQNRIIALEKLITDGLLGNIEIMNLDIIENFNIWGKSNLILTGNTPPNVIPDFVGQTFIDTTNKVAYTATSINSVNDWK